MAGGRQRNTRLPVALIDVFNRTVGKNRADGRIQAGNDPLGFTQRIGK